MPGRCDLPIVPRRENRQDTDRSGQEAAQPMTDIVAFPQDRTCPYEPAPGYRPLAERRPIAPITLYGGGQGWAVTGYELTRTLLSDPRISSDRDDPAWPVSNAAAAAAAHFSDAQKKAVRFLTGMVGVDGHEHHALRAPVAAILTPGLVDALRPAIREIVDRALDDMVERGAPADLVQAFAFPVPLTALYTALGIPAEDHEYFTHQSRQIIVGQDVTAAHDEFVSYVDKLVARKRQDPGESVLDALVREHGDVDPVGTLQTLLILVVSGHHTTASTIALGTHTLLRHRELLAELRADPSLLGPAVDELTRIVAVPDGLQRIAAADIEVGDTTIRKGDGVFFLFSLVNRDPEHYERPDSPDWHRPSYRDHLTFGSGPHECLGADLARAIMEIAYRGLFERLPGLRLAGPADDTPVKPGEAFQGLVELPVTW
jgi:pentalenic acid synthase